MSLQNRTNTAGDVCPPFFLHVQRDGERTTHRFSKREITLGRSRERDVPLSEKSISRHHVTIEIRDRKVVVIDEGSQNGTWIQGIRVEQGTEAELRPGDVLRIGSFEITVQFLADTADAGDTHTAEETGHSDGGLDTSTFARLIQALNEELDPDRLLTIIVDAAIRTTEAERGFLVLDSQDNAPSRDRTRSQYEVRVGRNFVGETVSDPLTAISKTIVGECLGDGEPRLTVNAQDDERFSALQSVEDLRLRSVLCVPLRVAGNIEGVLYLDNRLQHHAFDEHDKQLLVVVSDISGVAIRNVRLMQDLTAKNEALVEAHDRVADLAAKLEGRVRKQADELSEVRQELAASRRALGLRHDYRSIVGESEAMQDVFRLLDRYVDSQDPVLVLGESGTGKELIAKALHEQGPRAEGPFVSENCAALPASLLESELFGYVKGAFTGAVRDHKGLFEQAKGGTLFLDEVGDMSADLQSKLLRVLQEREIRPVGSSHTIPIDVRLVTATHRDVAALVKSGEFREDLFYRLHVLPLRLPPLRERIGDVPLLVQSILSKACVEARRPVPRISSKALDLLAAHSWPGNVRELENEIRRALLLAEGVIDAEQLSEHIQNPSMQLHDRSPLPAESGTTLPRMVRLLEESEIRRSLKRAEGNKSKAGELLGISRFALQRKLDKYGLDDDGNAASSASDDKSAEEE
ncbi:MAG: sigma 54-interacting transcriptional regulator [Planctomycetes bacterium]|nr:sigma 54-interacting transcriptional regulator [Planctomycetota bacterium]